MCYVDLTTFMYEIQIFALQLLEILLELKFRGFELRSQMRRGSTGNHFFWRSGLERVCLFRNVVGSQLGVCRKADAIFHWGLHPQTPAFVSQPTTLISWLTKAPRAELSVPI